MAETLAIPVDASRKEIYESLLPQIEALVGHETDLIANLANTTAALKQAFGFFWIGFYLAKENELVLGPFQGTIACTRIPFEKGVCGAAYRSKQTIVVEDVEKFEGHIACSSASKSEIVVPILNTKQNVCMVLDIDSDKIGDFDTIDKVYLEKLATILSQKCLD